MKLTDDSPMPFGKHRGEKMADVPASYLLWLGAELALKDKLSLNAGQRGVLDYVADNRRCLRLEDDTDSDYIQRGDSPADND